MARVHLGTVQHPRQRDQHFLQIDFGFHLLTRQLGSFGIRAEHVALEPRHRVQLLRCALEAFVFLQPADQLCARIVFVFEVEARPRQQHARLDLGEQRGHHEILGGEFPLQRGHQLDVLHVLAGDLGDFDVEDVEVLAADQIQQQIERTFERLEKYFERIGRDVQVGRQLRERLTADDCVEFVGVVAALSRAARATVRRAPAPIA